MALHVGTHECAVGVIVFKERNQTGGNGNELFRRHVHVVNFRRSGFDEFTTLTSIDALVFELAGLGDDVGRPGDEVVFLLVSC